MPRHARQLVKRCFGFAVAVLFLASSSDGATATDGRPALDVIVDAFDTHALVAVGEAHGNVSDHEFRLALIRDAHLFARVDDVVVEFGNARYQDVLDRFVAGERIPEQTLRHVWQDTTMPHTVWDRPIYEAFFSAVRDLNAGPRRTQPLRVVLGDPPIDWNSIRSADDQRRWQALRVAHAASVISKEVVNRKRRALIFYGGAHLWRADLSRETLIERLESTLTTRVFTVMPDDNRHVPGRTATVVIVPTIRLTRGTSLENQVDAMLDLPGRETDPGSPLSPALCTDRDYLDMRRHRLALVPGYQSFSTIERECRPDLSGTWTPERRADAPPPPPAAPPAPPAAPGVPPPPPPPTLVSLTIRQSSGEVRIERTMQVGSERAVYTFTYNLDGTEATNQMGPILSKGTAAWNGERLVITSTYYHDGKQIGRGTETYGLEQGKLIVEGERIMPGGRFPSREIYSKGS